MPPLSNQRHERFAKALFEGETADEAYEQAGFKANRGNASRLKANENIMARLTELQTQAAKASEVTVQSLLNELEAARERRPIWINSVLPFAQSKQRPKLAE
jgi:phage terminase small subunit